MPPRMSDSNLGVDDSAPRPIFQLAETPAPGCRIQKSPLPGIQRYEK
jgi:hypothetical protein